MQTKMVSVNWKWQSRTARLDRAARELDGTPGIPDNTRAQLVEHSEPNQKEIESLEDRLQSMFSQALKFPFLFRVGVLDELEHKVDSIIVVVDATNEQIFLQVEKLLQDKMRLDELRARHPKSEQEKGTS
jgi:hypothetical protein